MTIQPDLGHLSSPQTDSEERSAVFARVLIEAWKEEALSRGTLEHSVPGTTMRHSMSGKCARQIHYYLTGAEMTNLFDLPAFWSTGLGTMIHQLWQEALAKKFSDVEVEKVVHIPEADSSGHVDAWIPEGKASVEVKTINGYGFKKIAETDEGPRYSDFVQCCVNAYALGADKAILIYLSLEAISKPRANKLNIDEIGRIAKEFHYTPEIFNEVAEKEIQRWAVIRERGADTPRAIPDPEFTKGARVVDPTNGKMEKDGKPAGYAWMCGYCSYQDLCASEC